MLSLNFMHSKLIRLELHCTWRTNIQGQHTYKNVYRRSGEHVQLHTTVSLKKISWKKNSGLVVLTNFDWQLVLICGWILYLHKEHPTIISSLHVCGGDVEMLVKSCLWILAQVARAAVIAVDVHYKTLLKETFQKIIITCFKTNIRLT